MNEELTVLVADDEPELLQAVCQLIDWQALGYRLVGRASNGLDALQLVEELQPDFLLTDIRMPFISGTALTRQAKAVQPLLQVAFLSGYDDFEYAKSGIEDGIVAYLLKPISMAELTAELEKIHEKIVSRLASLTKRRGPEEREIMTASLLLDEFCHRGEIISRLAQSGVAISNSSTIIVGVIRVPGAQTADVLAAAERILSRVCGCCGFCADERVVLLLAAENGFGTLYGALDELRQAIRRTCGGAEAQIGLSKEHGSVAEGHAAYLEAMEALQAARGGEVQAAGGWDDMAVLCARAMKIIEKEYMDETLTLQSVSERLHVSPNYLGANLKKHAGDTFMNILIRKRMDVARNLIQNGPSRIAEVARRCGYSDQSYFGYCFKKYYGMSPARMRQTAAEHGETAQ